MVVLGIGSFLFAESLIRIFFSGNPEVSLGIIFFRIMAFCMPFFGAYIIFEGVFTGSGDTVPLMTVGAVYMWVFQVPGVFLLTRTLDFGPEGVWWALALSLAAASLLFYVLFLRRKWLHRKV